MFPTTPKELHSWLKLNLNIDVPTKAVCPNHQAPFEYLRRAYFEPACDCVVWAPRGGGKTRLAAAATLLDLLAKPGCTVRILGGSLEQSLRMWEHLLPDIELHASELLVGSTRARIVRLTTGSSAAVLTQSQRAVRGQRVQKLRCDEVECFDPSVWEAAQLVTRSRENIRGTVEALSTFHKPHGLMARVIERAQTRGLPVLRWCLLDVLQRCPPERDCNTCPLWNDCQGLAKTACQGFFGIDDAIAMQQRVSRECWETEILCHRPSTHGLVFPSFDVGLHVRETPPTGQSRQWLGIDFGFANPFVCLWIEAIERDRTFVLDEYVQPGRTIDQHIVHITSNPYHRAQRIACDPAGNGPNDQTALSNIQRLRQAGFIVKSRGSRIVDGIELIRSALRSASGDQRLWIHPRCKRLIKAMQAYRYPDAPGETPLKDNEHDHLIDALRYFFINRDRGSLTVRPY